MNKQLSKEEALKQIEDLKNYIQNLPKQYIVEDINGIENAEEILKDCFQHVKLTRNQFPTEEYWNLYQLKTISNAMNYLDNNNSFWIPNINNKENRWYPWFKFDNSSGWVFCVAIYQHSYSSGWSALSLKTENSANIIGKKFIHLFNLPE